MFFEFLIWKLVNHRKKNQKKNKSSIFDEKISKKNLKKSKSNNLFFFQQKLFYFIIVFFEFFLNFFFRKFFCQKIEKTKFFPFFFLNYWPSFVLQIQKTCVYSYPHFNMHFPLFQNSLFSQCKKWKIEKIEFFCAYCVHTQKKFYETTLWCYVVLQKIFRDFLKRSWY